MLLKNIELLQGKATKFTDFCDEVIYAITNGKINLCNIHTNHKTDLGDGGVDTKIDQSMADESGYFEQKTIWQYKASKKGVATKSKLKNEINNPYVRELIEKGYAYRFCIADSMTPKEIEEKQKILTDMVRGIYHDAPEAKILDANVLAQLAKRYPALFLAYFNQSISSRMIAVKSYLDSLRCTTKHYVKIEKWSLIMQKIKLHADFSFNPENIFLTIYGVCGSGKSRCVCETIAENMQALSMACYVGDEKHLPDIINSVINDSNQKIIIVTDECSLEICKKLEERLRNCMSRIRIIAITNNHVEVGTFAPEYEIKQMSDGELSQVLKINYPEISLDDINVIVSVTDGNIKFATNMCDIYHESSRVTNISDLYVGEVNRYFEVKLSESDRVCVQAISLVTKVGYKGNVIQELDDLCKTLKLERRDVQNSLAELCGQSGFVSRKGRYFCVTPEIIAKEAFRRGYEYFVSPIGLKEFVKMLPLFLLGRFLGRVASSGTDKIRGDVRDFFIRWASSITFEELKDVWVTKKLITLIGVDSTTYLLVLRDLIKNSDDVELYGLSGNYENQDYGSRRHIVFLCEKMAAFKEYFDHSEYILRRLAVSENEPNIGNNATAQWLQLFRIELSGTEKSFDKRFHLLKKIISDYRNADLLDLAFKALGLIFEHCSYRSCLPLSLNDRVVPQEWNPLTYADVMNCRRSVIDYLFELIGSGHGNIKERAKTLIIDNTRFLLAFGYLDQLKNKLETNSPEQYVDLYNGIQDYLEYDVKNAKDDEYIKNIESWIKSIKEVDRHIELVTIIGIEPWRVRRDRQSNYNSQIQQIAKTLYFDPDFMADETDWLFSEHAKLAYNLGQELAKLDGETKLLDSFIEMVSKSEYFALTKGYVAQASEGSSTLITKLNSVIDEMEGAAPDKAVQLSLASWKKLHAVSRIYKLINRKRLPLRFLKTLMWGEIPACLTGNEIYELFSLCLSAPDSELNDALYISEEFLGLIFAHNQSSGQMLDSIKQKYAIDMILRVLKYISEKANNSREKLGHWWAKVLESLIAYDKEMSLNVAVRALLSRNYDLRLNAEKILINYASKYGALILRLLSEKVFKSDVSKYYSLKTVIAKIDARIAEEFVSVNGLDAARGIAFHLPAPYFDEEKVALFPDITRFVLEKYGDDDEVYDSFCCGCHSLKVYSGDIAGKLTEEADLAKHFYDDDCEPIRRWANREYCSQTKGAELYQNESEEAKI